MLGLLVLKDLSIFKDRVVVRARRLMLLLLFLAWLDERRGAASLELVLVILVVPLLDVVLQLVILELFLDPVRLLPLDLYSVLVQLQVE